MQQKLIEYRLHPFPIRVISKDVVKVSQAFVKSQWFEVDFHIENIDKPEFAVWKNDDISKMDRTKVDAFPMETGKETSQPYSKFETDRAVGQLFIQYGSFELSIQNTGFFQIRDAVCCQDANGRYFQAPQFFSVFCKAKRIRV